MHSTDLRCVLLAGADLSLVDCNSCTVLHHVVLRGDIIVLASVLKHMATQADADLNATDELGQTALVLAVGHVTGSDNKKYEVPSSVCVALIEAGRTFRLYQMYQLETNAGIGADLTIASPKGETALHSAARRGNLRIVQTLLEYNASVDAQDCEQLTPLMVAMLNFRLQDTADMQLNIEALIAANADLNAVDQDDRSALMIAVSHLNSRILGTLLDTFRVPASVCIALIEAGQKCHLHKLRWFEACCC